MFVQILRQDDKKSQSRINRRQSVHELKRHKFLRILNPNASPILDPNNKKIRSLSAYKRTLQTFIIETI